MTIYFFFNSSGINIVWISTTHAITAMKKIGAHDIPIDNINHPVEMKQNKTTVKQYMCCILYDRLFNFTWFNKHYFVSYFSNVTLYFCIDFAMIISRLINTKDILRARKPRTCTDWPKHFRSCYYHDNFLKYSKLFLLSHFQFVVYCQFWMNSMNWPYKIDVKIISKE